MLCTNTEQADSCRKDAAARADAVNEDQDDHLCLVQEVREQEEAQTQSPELKHPEEEVFNVQ